MNSVNIVVSIWVTYVLMHYVDCFQKQPHVLGLRFSDMRDTLQLKEICNNSQLRKSYYQIRYTMYMSGIRIDMYAGTHMYVIAMLNYWN